MFSLSSNFQRFKNKRKKNIWQLFRATDLESLMYPCCTFCRIMGIFPYKIEAMTIKTSKADHIISTIIMCVFCAYSAIHFYDFVSKSTLYIKAGTLRILERTSLYILSIFIAIITFIFNKPRMRLLQSILEISSKLSSESYQNLSRLIHAKDIFGFLFINGQMLMFYFVMPFGSLQKLFMLYVYLMMFQIDMFYMNCVCILKACFKQINDNLVNLQELVANGEPHLLSAIHHEQRNPFLEMEIIALKKQHMVISDIVQRLNMIFSLQLLATIVLTFVQVILNVYFYVVQVHSIAMILNDLQKNVYYEYTFIAILYYLTKIVVIIWACETGKNEAMKISITVYDVFNGTNNKQIKYEVN